MFSVWFVVTGSLLIGMALAGSVLKRLPLTAAMFYLTAGTLLGPWGVGLLQMDALDGASGLERLTEIAVIISLFTAGLKLRLPVSDRRWRAAMLLATIAMVLTIAGVAAFAVAALDMPLGAAVLLGAVLAPTDPVLASDVQVEHEHDAEPVRLSLTGEAGLNDGTAFPFVLLGLGLMGTHELGVYGWRWLAIDVAWAVVAGLGVGTLCGAGIGKLVLYLRRVHLRRSGWTSSSRWDSSRCPTDRAAHARLGFLAVFAAGLSVRRIEREHSDVAPPADVADRDAVPTNRRRIPASLPRTWRVPSSVSTSNWNDWVKWRSSSSSAPCWRKSSGWGRAPCWLSVCSPSSGHWRRWSRWRARPCQEPSVRSLRGSVCGEWVGLLPGLAVSHGVPAEAARTLADITLVVVAASIVVHGVSVTPLMRRYSARAGRRVDHHP